MTRLQWDPVGQHLYETGVKQGVLYTQGSNGAYTNAAPWNGLRQVQESPSGADETKLFANDSKYLGIRAAEEFGGTIGAYTYPDEWAECDGSATLVTGVTVGQQPRKPFGLCYRTTIGNDTQLESYGYKLHLVYNATASPSERAYETINDSPSAIEFSWQFSTTPVPVVDQNGNNILGLKPTSILVIDSTKVDATKLTALEEKLYGSANSEPELPLPGEVYALLQ